jgi:hypothetical protein
MLPIKYSEYDLNKMKKIPGTFMWIKDLENKNKIEEYKKKILSIAKIGSCN